MAGEDRARRSLRESEAGVACAAESVSVGAGRQMDIWEIVSAAKEVFGNFQSSKARLAEEMHRTELRLGIRIPTALRTLYEETGDHSLHDACHGLISAANWRFVNGVLVFYRENQGVSLWGIAKGELAADDPPVVELVEMFDGSTLAEPMFESVSVFLGFMIAWQAVEGALPMGGIVLPESVTSLGDADARSQAIRLSAPRFGRRLVVKKDEEVWFRSGSIAHFDGKGHLGLACRDAAEFQAASEVFGIERDDWNAVT